MTNKKSRTKQSALSLVTGIGGQLLNEALRFVTRTVFIYTLGKVFLGINGLFSEIMTMLALTELGFGTAIIYRLYKPLAEGDAKQVRVLLKFYRRAYHIIGLIILLVGIALLPFLRYLIKDYDSIGSVGLNAEIVYLLFLSQSVISYFCYAYRASLLTADQKQYILNTTSVIVELLRSVLQIIVLLLWCNFIAYLVIAIISAVSVNLLNAYIARKKYPVFFEKEKDSLPKTEVKTMLKDCMALFVYKVNGVVQKSTGNLIISAFIGLSTVAVYSNYLLVYAAIRQLASQFFIAIKGSTGNLFATSSMENQYSFFELLDFITAIIYGTIGVTVAINVNVLMTSWLGAEYLISQPYPLLLGCEIFLLGLTLSLNQIRNATGLFRQMWARPVFGMIINLVSTLLLVRVIGVFAIPLGYIIAVTSTNITADPIIIYRYAFSNKYNLSDYYFRNFFMTMLLMALGVMEFFLCELILPDSTWLSFILRCIICAVLTPSIILFLFKNTNKGKYTFSIIQRITNRTY